MTNSPAATLGDAASGPVPPKSGADAGLPPSVGAFHYTRYDPRTPELARQHGSRKALRTGP